jgi:uncharacterized membrane protein
MHLALLALASFAASAVEMVEALTIALAVGVTRGWRSVAVGATAAVLALGVIVAALGPALTHIPLNSLRLVVGALLAIFGLTWLRKAVLRAGGAKALHDEDAIYREELERLSSVGQDRGAFDWYGFTVVFKGVLLEGLEVAFIVLTFGATQGHIGVAALAALGALVVVLIVGFVVHAPLSRVPENTLKFAVGVMLTAFGTFWATEGVGAHWPGGDAFIPVLIGWILVCALGMVALVRRHLAVPHPQGAR